MKIGTDTRIYIAGCGGMLGEAVYGRFASIATVKATDIDVNADWLTYADIRDYAAIRESIISFEPQIVINLAAMTDLEDCERDPDNAWLTNALGAENAGLVANEIDAAYVYISTAGIFDGQQETYNDFDTPRPLGAYGRSKHYGEAFVSACVRKYFVPRAGWMMGGGPKKDKKFVNKIYRQICAGAKELLAVDDKAGTPTYTVDFAAGIQRLLESGMYGIYNHAGQGRCSRLDVAREFVRLLGLHDEVAVRSVDSGHFAKDYFADRPASEALVNLKLQARGFPPMRDWQACLAEYSAVFAKDWAIRSGMETGQRGEN